MNSNLFTPVRVNDPCLFLCLNREKKKTSGCPFPISPPKKYEITIAISALDLLFVLECVEEDTVCQAGLIAALGNMMAGPL